jgi:hypothetical protein
MLGLLMSLGACGDALIYGERTSVDVASVRLNDDAAQPLSINLGFNRQVVTVAPPLCGTVVENGKSVASGEAISQFSTFRVKAVPAFVGEAQPTLLAIQSRFASGQAARDIAKTPEVVAAVLGLTPFSPADEEKHAAYLKCINEIGELPKLLSLAQNLQFQLGPTDTANLDLAKMAITDRLNRTADWIPFYPTLDATCI